MKRVIQQLKDLIFRTKEEIFDKEPELRYPTKSVSVRDAIGDSYEYSRTPDIILTEKCKEVTIWYDRDAVNAYKAVMKEYFGYNRNRGMISDPISEVERYVYAWNDSKIVTSENVIELAKLISNTLSWISHQRLSAGSAIQGFYGKNNTEVLVDSKPMKLYEFTDKVPYHRIYAMFFRKSAIPQKAPVHLIQRDVEILDRIIVILDTLHAGWGKVGPDAELTELYRRRQQDLLSITHSYVDAIEMDIALLEEFKKASRTSLNVKIYPVHMEV